MLGGFRDLHLKKYIVHQGNHSTHEKVLSPRELYGFASASSRLLDAGAFASGDARKQAGREKSGRD
jgi:hypothetical protein